MGSFYQKSNGESEIGGLTGLGVRPRGGSQGLYWQFDRGVHRGRVQTQIGSLEVR